MIGMNRETGKPLDSIAHLKQSITDILTTPLGSRVMRRDYGSKIFELLDAPLNSSTTVDIAAATIEAINQWEPRFQIEKVETQITEGKVVLNLIGTYKPTGEHINLEGIQL